MGGSAEGGGTADPSRPARDTPSPAEPGRARSTVLQGGRAKAYRPISPQARAAALAAGLDAYRRGDFFEAHEVLEPAWMGTADPGERALYQGLIKLAAGFVHAVRGNPRGVENNLRGARVHLAAAARAGHDGGLDLATLLADLDARLAVVAALPSVPPRAPGTSRFASREPVAVEPPGLVAREGPPGAGIRPVGALGRAGRRGPDRGA